MKLRHILLILPLLLLLATVPATAASGPDEGWQAVGFRFGFSMTEKYEYFHQYEAFGVYGMPFHWRSRSGWGVSTKFNVSAGDLHCPSEDTFVGTFGVSAAFDKNGRGFQLEVGPDFVVLGHDRVGQQDFGGLGLFQGHASLSYIFQNGLGIGYRAQHSSNAGLYGPVNPGYDMHMFQASWNF